MENIKPMLAMPLCMNVLPCIYYDARALFVTLKALQVASFSSVNLHIRLHGTVGQNGKSHSEIVLEVIVLRYDISAYHWPSQVPRIPKKNCKRPTKVGKAKSKARNRGSQILIIFSCHYDHLVLIMHRFHYFLVSRSLRSKRPY